MRSLLIKYYRQLIPVHVQGNLFFLAASGPLFLFAAFALILFRASWELWPFVLLSSIGLLASSLFKRPGFYLSLASLLTLVAFHYKILIEQPWCALFLTTTVLSWGIVLLGQEEIFQWVGSEGQKKEDLELSVRHLQEMVSLAHVQVEKEPRSSSHEFKAALASRNAAVENQNRAYEEIEKLRQRLDALNEEISGYQRKEKAFQVALDDAQAQVIKYKYAEPLKSQAVVNMKEEEKRFEGAEELAYQAQVQALIEQCQDLEAQVVSLEEIISTLSVKKKGTKSRKENPKVKKGSVAEMLQEVIGHKSGQYSLLD